MEYNGNLQAVYSTCLLQYIPLLNPFISLYKFLIYLFLFFSHPTYVFFYISYQFILHQFISHDTDRNKNHFYIPVVNLSCVQRGVSYSEVKIFNSLPSNIQSYRNDRERFKNNLYVGHPRVW